MRCAAQEVLVQRGWQEKYPLFTTTNYIINNQVPVTDITKYLEVPKRQCALEQMEDPFGIAH